MTNLTNTKKYSTSKFDLDGRPPLKEAIPLGLQHLLAMFIGNIVPMLLVSDVAGLDSSQRILLMQCCMFGASISTLIQLYPIKMGSYQIGAKLPVMLGLTYVFLPICISVAGQYGLGAIFGAQIVGGIVSIIFGLGLKKIRKFFPPVVTGTVVLSVGISLFSTAITNLAGGASSETFGSYTNWFVGVFVVCVVMFFSQFGKGLAKVSAILIGIVSGYILALFFGMVDLSPIKDAAWFALPKPFAFGLEFRPDLIGIFIILYFIVAIQMVGDYSVSAMGGLDRQPTDNELSGGIIGNSVSSVISAIINSFPTATYSQNSGIVALTKVSSRYVIAVGAAMLLISGFCPKIGALMSTIPQPVVGGGTLVVISMIATSGINLVTMEKLTSRGMVIVGVSLAFGIGITSAPDTIAQFPEWFKMFIGKSAITIATIIAFLLNMVFPKDEVE